MSQIGPANPKFVALYRRMIKSLMVVFDNDYEMFHRSRIEVRKSVEEYMYEEDKVKANEVLFQLEEGRLALLRNVMQGNL